jgi:hypothetical protein
VIVLPIFACYVQKGRRSARRRIEGPRCSMGSIVESSDATVGKTPKSLTESWNLSAQNTHDCAVGNMMPLELSTTHRPFKTVRRGEPVDSFETVRGKREGGRSYVSTIGMQRCTVPA